MGQNPYELLNSDDPEKVEEGLIILRTMAIMGDRKADNIFQLLKAAECPDDPADAAPLAPSPAAEADRIPRSVRIGEIEIRYVPRKKVIIEHQGRLAEYHFEKLKALSHDEGFLDAAGLKIQELGVVFVDLGPRTVLIEVADSNFALEYNFDD